MSQKTAVLVQWATRPHEERGPRDVMNAAAALAPAAASGDSANG